MWTGFWVAWDSESIAFVKRERSVVDSDVIIVETSSERCGTHAPLPMINRYSDLFVTAFSSLINCCRREECFENRERRKRELNQ